MSMSLESNEVDSLSVNTNQATLFEQHGRAIFAYLRLHLVSVQDAEDLLLDIFLAALENDNLAHLEDGKQLAWLKRVAHNKLLNTYRRMSKRSHVSLDTIVENMLADDDPEQRLLRQEQQQQLHMHLHKLSTLQQQILQLRYGDGLRCPEIALLLGKSEEAVRKTLSHSILFLRQTYQQTEGDSSC
jgi:RNA polymerase sigma factor (sigma-70 family)